MFASDDKQFLVESRKRRSSFARRTGSFFLFTFFFLVTKASNLPNVPLRVKTSGSTLVVVVFDFD